MRSLRPEVRCRSGARAARRSATRSGRRCLQHPRPAAVGAVRARVLRRSRPAGVFWR